MEQSNVEIMRMAQSSLKGKWGLAIGTFLVYGLLTGVIQIGVRYYSGLSLISIIIAGPISVGAAIFSLAIARNKDAKLEQLFEGFNNFKTSFLTYLLMVLFVFLWALLLIIPGIIAGLSYSMAFYIIADDNSIEPMEAIDKSKKMMDGYKWKLFRLVLRLFGLGLLCILTLGIGFLWLVPFAQVTMATFYENVKENMENSDRSDY